MAAPDLTAILRMPGRLSINPVSLTTGSYPWGGTALGLVEDVAAKPSRSHSVIREEAFGNEIVDVIDTGESWVLAAKLRSFDADAIQQVFPATSVGAVTATRGILYPGTFRAGRLLSSVSVRLLFTPNDTERYPFVYFYQALPLVDEAAELTLKLAEEAKVAVVFYAVRDTSDRVVAVQRREDITI